MSSFSNDRCLFNLRKLMGSISVANSPPSSLLGDYIGAESCLDLRGNVVVSDENGSESQSLSPEGCRAERDQKWGQLGKTKEFPPPIPSLARTENLSSHMPWVLKRYYTTDGRLVLKEERVKHHEYFLARRFNGRLTLQLVPLDDEIDHNYPPCSVQEEEDGDEIDEVNSNSDEEVKESEINDYNAVDYEDERRNKNNNGGIVGNLCPSFNCLNYNTVIQSSTSIFQMPVPALRPVHT